MTNATVEWLVAQWTLRFGEITLTMGDLQPKMHVGHIEESAIKGDLLWWEQPFTCAPDSPVWTGAPEETWTEIGKIILAAAGVDPAPATRSRARISKSSGNPWEAWRRISETACPRRYRPQKGPRLRRETSHGIVFRYRPRFPANRLIFTSSLPPISVRLSRRPPMRRRRSRRPALAISGITAARRCYAGGVAYF